MSIGDSRDRSTADKVCLELSDGKSHKFYEVTVDGTAITTRYGRIGTTGQSSSSTAATPEKAQAEARKKINEKLKKGYVQVSSAGDRPISAEQLLADSRHYWVYGNAWFASDGHGGWEESNEETRQRGQSWQFQETTRTGEYVELYDQSRRVTVRLTATAMLVRWDRDGSDAEWEEYHKGQWQERQGDRPASESPQTSSEISLSQEATRPPAASPPLPPIDPTVPAPSRELMNQSPLYPPRVARSLLPNVRHHVGFSFREVQICNLSIPLPRSLTCIEIVGTIHDLAHSDFGFRLMAHQGRESVHIYGFNFRSRQAQMMQSSMVAGVYREEQLELPNPLASGQLVHHVLVITAEGNIVSYLNNQPFAYPIDLSDPPNTLHLGYDTTGFKLEQLRVLAEPMAESPIPRSSPAVVTPVPSPGQRPLPSQEITDSPPFLEDLPAQFAPLRSFLQQNLMPYIKIQVGEEVGSMDFFNQGPGDPLTVWQSKIGGNPYFPKTAEYPIDANTGKAMPLLLQINCADVPPIAGFDFPQAGILQFYLGFEPADASATPGKYRVLYFPEILTNPIELVTDFSFIERDGTIRELYPEVHPIAFSVSRDLFWESRAEDEIDCPEEFAELWKEFVSWIGDYDYEHGTEMRDSKLGGYSETDELAELWVPSSLKPKGRLLLELIHPDMVSDSFVFFISDEQLRDRDFSDVEFHFVCD